MARSPWPNIPTRLVDIEVVESDTAPARRNVPLAALVHAGATDGEPADSSHTDLIAATGATGKAGEVHTVQTGAAGNGSARWLAGIGQATGEQLRTAGAALIQAVDSWSNPRAGRVRARTIQLELPGDLGAADVAELATGVQLGGYRYRVSAEPALSAVRAVRLLLPAGRAAEPYVAAVERAAELARSSALARDLANTPSNRKDPAWLAACAERVATGHRGLTVTVRDEAWLREQGFGGVLAVGGGSASPPRLIEMSYRPRGARSHLLLVGKGITFDTGGISIKPADGMHLMRTDMSGGAAVIAAIRAIAALRADVRVTALIPAAENHVSGSAYRPGDVIRHYGGRTTEVTNTDAEGRMVLADALAYGIKRFRPDAVLDVATLTGAMKVALGLRTGGFFASDDELADRVLGAGAAAGERWWRMPLLDEHAEAVCSELADVRQAPPGPGGITAALFLREFTDGLPWAHLDIAGPARAETTYAEVVPGGTGFAARTLVELVLGYA